jgi:hypothetical protein
VPKALSPYQTPVTVPKVIRTSELAKNQSKKQR